MSRASTSIAYDGPILKDGTMDVRDLAPALLAVGQLVDAANAVLNGDTARVSVKVRAAEVGSFEISFDVIQTLGEHLIAILNGRDVTAANALCGLIFGSISTTGGVIWLIKKCRGRNPSKIEKVTEQNVRLVFEGEAIEIPFALLRLYQSIPVRAAAQQLVEEPLRREGIESFEVRENKDPVVRVEKAESFAFAKPEIPDETLIDEVRRSAYSIISLAFKEDNKWRLHDGSNAISATIQDHEFQKKVDANQISFSKGDILLCDVRIVQRQTDQGLKTDYTVVRVIEHRLAARQLPLPFDPSGSPDY